MEKCEVIYISSDDEKDTQQNEKNTSQNPAYQKPNNNYTSHMKVEVVPHEDENTETCGRKRKLSNVVDNNTNGSGKKIKLSSSENESDDEMNNVDKSSDKPQCIPQQKEQQDKTVLKPKLIVKERRSISQVEQDTFPMFISLCLQRDRSEDMKVIVSKLKRRYEQLDSTYANSENFINFLNKKRNDIMNSKHKLYVHVAEVMTEMKNRSKGKSSLLNGRNYSSEASCSSALTSKSNSLKDNAAETKNADDREDEEKLDDTERKVRLILCAMKKCEKYIKKLEEAETDFDDENNSNYIKLEKFKYRMVELYNKLCEYTGENADAGRPYLRPKHLSTTGIVAVDQAITSFINSKISKRNKLKKIGAQTDGLIFPDYRDILQCVKRCNDLHSLGLNTKRQQLIAKKAFTELGEYLQRVRHNDYWDTFSLFLENKEDDPALKDPDLAEKLIQNKIEGEKRLANVFQEYVKKQEEMKEQNQDDKVTSEDEEHEDNSVENEEEDNGDEVEDISDDDGSSSSDDNKTNADEDENSTDRDRILINKVNSNVNDKHSRDENKSTANQIKEDESKSNANQIEADERESNANRMEAVENESNANQTEADVHLETSDKVLHKDDRVNKDNNSKSTDIKSSVTVPNRESDSQSEVTKENNITSSDANVSSNEKESATITNTVDTDKKKEDAPTAMCKESTDDKPLEEEKPLLRVRSFAKPPTTWEDGRQKTDEPIKTGTAPKVVPKDTVIDLTNESPKPIPVVTKCATVQIGSKILPVGSIKGKYRTLVIPMTGKSVINVKNITNNYVRFNPQGMSQKNVSKLQTVQPSPPLQAVGINGASTIVRLSPNSSNNQHTINPSKPGNAIRNLQVKQNNAIIRIAPRNTILVTKKQRDNTLKSPTTNSPTSKSK